MRKLKGRYDTVNECDFKGKVWKNGRGAEDREDANGGALRRTREGVWRRSLRRRGLFAFCTRTISVETAHHGYFGDRAVVGHQGDEDDVPGKPPETGMATTYVERALYEHFWTIQAGIRHRPEKAPVGQTNAEGVDMTWDHRRRDMMGSEPEEHAENVDAVSIRHKEIDAQHPSPESKIARHAQR